MMIYAWLAAGGVVVAIIYTISGEAALSLGYYVAAALWTIAAEIERLRKKR